MTAHILVVDDSRLVRMALVRNLKDHFEIREEGDGEAAWQQLLLDHSIKAVISDLQMPKLDGAGLLQRVRASKQRRLQEMPFIVVSGEETEEERETALRLEQKVKLVVKHTIRQRTPGMAQLSRLLMYKSMNKLPNAFMRRCECTASRRNPWCDMPVKFCKHTTLGLAKIVPRKTKSLGSYRSRAKSDSPRTRKSHGGKGRKRIRKRSQF